MRVVSITGPQPGESGVVMKSAILLASVVAISLVGGMASNVMFQTNTLNADDLAEFKACLEVVKREGQFSDLSTPGKLLRLYARDGGERVQVGTYSGHYSSTESGLPLVGLFDNRAKLRLLLRLAGPNESPVLVFKDGKGSDRMVIGLALNDAGEEPFLAYFDREGVKHTLLGTW